MIKKAILLCFLLVYLSSCKLAMMGFYGIKSPKIETKKSLVHYLHKKHISTDDIYTVSYLDYKELNEKLDGIPDIMLFDKKGNLIKDREENQCNASAFATIDSLTPNTPFTTVNNKKVEDLLSKLKDFEGHPISFKKDENVDYYLFIFWARYVGRLNKDHMKVWETSAKNNPNAKIKVFKVNFDKHKWWKKNE